VNLILFWFDVRPDPVGPVGLGILAVVVFLVVGLLLLTAAGLVFFLWYRKRKLRTVEMIRADASPVMTAAAQPNNPNQP
jgi:hypothetical protein